MADALNWSVNNLQKTLEALDTELVICLEIMTFSSELGNITLDNCLPICLMESRYKVYDGVQDIIGWHHFMEGKFF